MPDAIFNEMMEQIDMLSYLQRMTLLKKIVASFDTPKRNFKPLQKEIRNDAFGIWKDTDISVDTIRRKAWR